jgi:hypothetical protein
LDVDRPWCKRSVAHFVEDGNLTSSAMDADETSGQQERFHGLRVLVLRHVHVA